MSCDSEQFEVRIDRIAYRDVSYALSRENFFNNDVKPVTLFRYLTWKTTRKIEAIFSFTTLCIGPILS